jgi:hypothetical protein
MITIWRRLTTTTASVLLAAATAASCRSGGVCESIACSSDGVSVGGAAGEQAGALPADAAGMPAHEGGEGGVGGAGGSPSAGAVAVESAGEAGQPSRLECEGNWADCDESRLTGCETDLTWSVRHCGACGADCDGLCVSGRCEPSTLVADRLLPHTMVASATTGFARASDGRGNYSIVRVDMESGDGEVIQSQVAEDVVLALGADRVYFFDPDTAELRSTGLDGASLTLEQELSSATAFGASPQGAYYVETVTDPDTWDETETLWFRATGTAVWKKLRGPGQIDLYRSSPFGVVASEHDMNGVPHLQLLRGSEVKDFGEEPASLIEAVATRSAIAALSGSHLHWLTADAASSYEIEPSSNYYNHLIVLGDDVAILSESNGKAGVRFYSSGGPVTGTFGVAPSSNLVFADSSYFWYGVDDNWLERRFLRSLWFSPLP